MAKVLMSKRKDEDQKYAHTRVEKQFSRMEAEVERKNYQKGQTLKDLKGKFRIIT